MSENSQAGAVRYPESHYQLAGWAATIRVMGNMVHEIEYLNVRKYDTPKKHLFKLCLAAAKYHDEFVPLIEDACEPSGLLLAVTHRAGLVSSKRSESTCTVNPLVKRAAAALFGESMSKDRAILDRLDGEIKLVTDFYVSDKKQQMILEDAKQDTDPYALPQQIKKIQTDAAFYIGYYEREREERWEN